MAKKVKTKKLAWGTGNRGPVQSVYTIFQLQNFPISLSDFEIGKKISISLSDFYLIAN